MANPEDNSASVTSGNCPAFGYTLILPCFYLFIMINLPYLSSVRIVLTLVALICDMSFLHMLNLVSQLDMIYILVLISKLPNTSTIHKPYYRSFPVPISSLVDAPSPEKFSGKHFKRWSVKITDWLTTMEVFWVKDGLLEGDISDKNQSKLQKVYDIFVGVVRNMLLNHLFDSMMHIRDANPLWDHNVHFVQRNFKGKNKGKGNQQPFNAKATTTFKKKKKNMSEMFYFTCGELEHFAEDCPKHADCKEKKVNLVTATNADDGYGSIPTVLSVFQSPSLRVLIFTCVLMSLYFLLTNCSKVLPF
jgi:hypothetical protein